MLQESFIRSVSPEIWMFEGTAVRDSTWRNNSKIRIRSLIGNSGPPLLIFGVCDWGDEKSPWTFLSFKCRDGFFLLTPVNNQKRLEWPQISVDVTLI